MLIYALLIACGTKQAEPETPIDEATAPPDEDGSHAELLARGGQYAGFWARQSGGFIGTEAVE